jgi:hypothetical protein
MRDIKILGLFLMLFSVATLVTLPSFVEPSQQLFHCFVCLIGLAVGLGFVMVDRELPNDVVKNEVGSVPRTERD